MLFKDNRWQEKAYTMINFSRRDCSNNAMETEPLYFGIYS